MNQTIDKESGIPVYLQLKARLEDEIARGELFPGKRIPSENELSRRYGIHRHTVRNSLRKLAEEGVLRSTPGSGWFVTPSGERTLRIGIVGNMMLNGYKILLEPMPRGAEASDCETFELDRDNLERQCRELAIDAVVIANNIIDIPRDWPMLASLGIPAVVVNRQPFGSDIPFVAIDQYYGARDLVARLVNAGHTRIGCIVSKQPLRYVSERFKGYCDALTAGNLEIDPELCCMVEDGHHFRDQLEAFFRCNREMTALFVGGQAFHDQTFDLIKERKLRIPEELSLAVYDRPPHEFLFVTYLEQPFEQLWLQLFRMVRRLCNGEQLTGETINPLIVNGKSILSRA